MYLMLCRIRFASTWRLTSFCTVWFLLVRGGWMGCTSTSLSLSHGFDFSSAGVKEKGRARCGPPLMVSFLKAWGLASRPRPQAFSRPSTFGLGSWTAGNWHRRLRDGLSPSVRLGRSGGGRGVRGRGCRTVGESSVLGYERLRLGGPSVPTIPVLSESEWPCQFFCCDNRWAPESSNVYCCLSNCLVVNYVEVRHSGV